MRNKAQDVRTYVFKAGESIMMDANIWLYLLPPAAQPSPRWAQSYSRAYSKMLLQNAKPVVDALILSEYLNRYVRIEYEGYWKSNHTSFKIFRKSPDASNVLSSAVSEIKQILKSATVTDTPLINVDVTAVLDQVQRGDTDFNDALLMDNCKRHGWKLMTHDGDMVVGGIEILTTNTRLLSACSV